MDNTATVSQAQATDAPKLKVDFTWKKFRAHISTVDSVNESSTPYSVVHFNLRKPHLEFNTADDKTLIGGGNVHAISINADYEVNGEKGQLKALKKFLTRYTHLSTTYGTPEKPMEMSWTTSSNFVDWDFICLDENKEPVARFNSSWWAVKKLGIIEFLGPKANDPACRDEMMVVGLTLWYTMVMRMNNIFNFFGAIFHKSGPIKQKDGESSLAPPPPYETSDDGTPYNRSMDDLHKEKAHVYRPGVLGGELSKEKGDVIVQ